MSEENNQNQFSNYSEEKLQSLYEELGRSATQASQQQAQFFGKGMQAGADIYQQAADDFTALQEKVKEELDARKEQQQQQQQPGAEPKKIPGQQDAQTGEVYSSTSSSTEEQERQDAQEREAQQSF